MHAADLLTSRTRLTPDREALLDLATGPVVHLCSAQCTRQSAGQFHERALGRAGGRSACRSTLAHNSVAYLDMFYGLAKIGAIFTPLNWRLTATELAYIVNDCTPKVIVIGPEFTGVWTEMLGQ